MKMRVERMEEEMSSEMGISFFVSDARAHLRLPSTQNIKNALLKIITHRSPARAAPLNPCK